MRFRGEYWAWFLLAGLLVSGVDCAKAPSDSQLSEQIQSKLKQDSGLQDKSITVQTSKGVVTLAGTVDNDAERTAAARYASTTPGIKEIVNNLQIAVASAPVAEPTSEMAASATNSSAPEKNSRPSEAEPAHPKPRPSSVPRQVAQDSSPPSSSANSKSSAAASDSTSNGDNSEAAPADKPVADVEAASEQADAVTDAPAAPAAPTMMTIESGTTMAVRLLDEIDSETAKQGQTFRATLDSPLSAEWDVAIPAGFDVEGHVVEVQSAGKFAGQSELVLTLDKILVHDQSYPIQTDDYRRKGKSQSTKTAEKVGVGAAIGAIIGGIAGGGKGAGIGAAAGGGLGGATQAASKGQPVRLSSETVLHFTLQSPVTVARVEPSPERRKLPPAKD